jgi:hypothetical protein
MNQNKKVKFYTQDISDLSFMADNASYMSGNIDMAAANLWDAAGNFRQNTSLPKKVYKTSIDTENKLRQPCSDNNKYAPAENYSKSERYAELTKIRDNATGTPVIDTVDNAVNNLPNNMSCSQRKHSLDWSGYRAPPVQITGRGFGILEDWDKLYIGQDTRNDGKAINPRSIENTNLAMLPLDGFKIDYTNNLDRYETDLRSGMDTRFANKKSMKN